MIIQRKTYQNLAKIIIFLQKEIAKSGVHFNFNKKLRVF